MSALATQQLSDCESRIERNLQGFYEVGKALAEIRDGRLYREEFESFETYVKERWGWERAHAYRMIDAAGIVEDVSPIGDKPTTESQARELSKLETPEESAARHGRK